MIYCKGVISPALSDRMIVPLRGTRTGAEVVRCYIGQLFARL